VQRDGTKASSIGPPMGIDYLRPDFNHIEMSTDRRFGYRNSPVMIDSFDAPSQKPGPAAAEPSCHQSLLEEISIELGRLTAVGSLHLWLAGERLSIVASYDSDRDSLDTVEPPRHLEAIVASAINDGVAAARHLPGGPSFEGAVSWWYVYPLRLGDVRGAPTFALGFHEKEALTQVHQVVDAFRLPLIGCIALALGDGRAKLADYAVATLSGMSTIRDTGSLAKFILERAVEMTDATTASVMAFDVKSNRLRIVAASGLPDHVVKSTAIALGEGVAGWVAATGRSMIVEDPNGGSGRGSRHKIKSALSVPLIDEVGLVGVLNVGSEKAESFSPELRELLTVFAKHAAVHWRLAGASTSLGDTHRAIMSILAHSVDLLTPGRSDCAQRMLNLTGRLGAAVGMSSHDVGALEVAALLYDLGMDETGIERIASRRPFTTLERGMLIMHPKIAATLTENTSGLSVAAPSILHHHEFFDGSGYASGLKGDQIPLGARVLAVVDAFVAMTSEKAFRPARTIDFAIRELLNRSGTQFDPVIVDAFIELLHSETSHQSIV